MVIMGFRSLLAISLYLGLWSLDMWKMMLCNSVLQILSDSLVKCWGRMEMSKHSPYTSGAYSGVDRWIDST